MKIVQQNMKLSSAVRKPANQKGATIKAPQVGLKNMDVKKTDNADVGTSVQGQTSPLLGFNETKYTAHRPRLFQCQQQNTITNQSLFGGMGNIMPGVLLRNNPTYSSAQTAFLNSPLGPGDERNLQPINSPKDLLISKREETYFLDLSDVITVVSPLQRRAFTVQQSLAQNQNAPYQQNKDVQEISRPIVAPQTKTPLDESDLDFKERMRLQLLKKQDEKLPQIRRVFLRSQAHSWSRKDAQLNFSDGIVVPHTLFNILTDKQNIQVTNHFFGKKLPLYVTVSDTRTFFNVNMNILHRHQLASQKKNTSSTLINGGRSQSANGESQGNIQSSSNNIRVGGGGHSKVTEIMARIYSIHEVSAKARNLNHTQTQKAEKLHQARQISLMNTKNISQNQQQLEELYAEDDDTVYMPQWMFEKLKISIGDPVCLIFDFEANKAMCGTDQNALHNQIASEVTFSIKAVKKSKMRQKWIHKSGNHVVMAGISRPNQESSISLYPEGQDIDKACIEKDFLKQFQQGLKSFKTLKVKDSIPVYLNLNNEIIDVTIEEINGGKDGQQLYLNSHPHGSTQILNFYGFDSFIEKRFQDLQHERSLAALRKNANNEPTDEQLLQMDLNEIVHRKGLRDLDLIEKVLAAKQRREQLVNERRRQIQLRVEEAAAAATRERMLKSSPEYHLNRASSIKVSDINKNSPLIGGKRKLLINGKTNTEALGSDIEGQPIIMGDIDLGQFKEVQKQQIIEQSRVIKNINSQNDSNLQRFTFDKNDDIRIKIERQSSSNHGIFQTHYLKMSNSSKTLVGSPSKMNAGENDHQYKNQQLLKLSQEAAIIPTSQELLIIDKQLLAEETAILKEFQSLMHVVKVPPSEVFKDTLTADPSRQEVVEAIADYQKKSVNKGGLPIAEKAERIMNAHSLQRMQIEFRSKKSGASVVLQQKQGNFGISLFGQRRKSSNFHLQIYRDSSPQNFRSKHQLLNQDEVDFLQIINSKEPKDISIKRRELKSKYGARIDNNIQNLRQPVNGAAKGMMNQKPSQAQLSELLFDTVPLHTESIMNLNNNSFNKPNKHSTFLKKSDQEIISCPNLSQRSLKRPATRGESKVQGQFKTILSGNCIMRKPIATVQGLTNRPKSVFMELRLNNHQALKKIAGQQQNDQLVLKSQLDQLAQDKRMRQTSAVNQSQSGRMNAMFNKHNQVIDKNRTMNNYYKHHNSLKDSQAIVIKKPLNQNMKQKQKDLIDDLEMAIKTPRNNQQIVIPMQNPQQLTMHINQVNQNDSTTNQSNSFYKQPVMGPADHTGAILTITQGGLSNIQIIQRGNGEAGNNQSMFQKTNNSKVQKQQASVSIPENASNMKLKKWIKIPHSQQMSFSQVKPIHPSNHNSSKKANGSKGGIGGKSSSVISKKNLNNSQMTLLDNDLFHNNPQAQLFEEDHLMNNDNIVSEDPNNYKMSNVSRYENLISEQIGEFTDMSPDCFPKGGILQNKLNGQQIMSPHTIQKMMIGSQGQQQNPVQERVYFGIPSPQMIDDDFTLTSGNQNKTLSVPLSPQSADFSYMFKQEIQIDGKIHNASLLGRVTSFLQKKKKSEQQNQHFYLNNPSTNYHSKPHPILKGPKYAKTQRVIKVPEGTTIHAKKIEIDENYYEIQTSSANALKHPLNDQFYYRSRSISPQNMSPTSIDQQQLSGTYVGFEQRREKGLKTLCNQNQSYFTGTSQKQQIGSKSQAIHQKAIKGSRRNIMRPKTQINSSRGGFRPQSPGLDYQPMSVRGQGKAQEIKLFKIKRGSKEPQVSSILMRDGVQVPDRIKGLRKKESEFVETRNVEIQQTSTLLNEQYSVNIIATAIVVTPEDHKTVKSQQNTKKRHISLIIK